MIVFLNDSCCIVYFVRINNNACHHLNENRLCTFVIFISVPDIWWGWPWHIFTSSVAQRQLFHFKFHNRSHGTQIFVNALCSRVSDGEYGQCNNKNGHRLCKIDRWWVHARDIQCKFFILCNRILNFVLTLFVFMK